MTTITDPTAQVLADMLTENTGRHMLDSGGAYGRNWERNQGETVESFMAKPATKVSTSSFTYQGKVTAEVTVEVDVFHFLLATCEFDAELDAAWSEFCDLPENADDGYLALAQEFPAWLAEHPEAGGCDLPDIDHRPEQYTVNTYNGEDALSQVLQYVAFSLDGGEPFYGEVGALVAIHGGADVRGGYTRPRAFRLNDEHLIGDNARIDAYCKNAPEPQDSALPTLEDDRRPHGFHWTSHNAGYDFDNEDGAPWDLKEIPWVWADDEADVKPDQVTVMADGKVFGPTGQPMTFSSIGDYA